MSEYQYYEFRAIDRPLSEAQQDIMRTLSRRAQVTPAGAIFTYSFGDFPGDALEILGEHADALLYLANWGTRRLAFRIPKDMIDVEALKPYWIYDEITLTPRGQHVLLDLLFTDEGAGEWVEGEGLLDALIPLRDDIMGGDLRALYLAYLKASQYGEPDGTPDDEDWAGEAEAGDGDDEESGLSGGPPVPAGLGELSASLQALVQFFDIDRDLIVAAAGEGGPLVAAEPRLEEWVARLQPDERDAWLVRVARGEPNVGARLVRRLREVGAR